MIGIIVLIIRFQESDFANIKVYYVFSIEDNFQDKIVTISNFVKQEPSW